METIYRYSILRDLCTRIREKSTSVMGGHSQYDGQPETQHTVTKR